MTIDTCIRLVDAMKPNGADALVKRRFLGEVEGRVRVELLGESPEMCLPFDENTPEDTELCVPHPYDQLYWMYLAAMLDYMSGDTVRYESGAALFNTAYQSFGKWLKRKGV